MVKDNDAKKNLWTMFSCTCNLTYVVKGNVNLPSGSLTWSGLVVVIMCLLLQMTNSKDCCVQVIHLTVVLQLDCSGYLQEYYCILTNVSGCDLVPNRQCHQESLTQSHCHYVCQVIPPWLQWLLCTRYSPSVRGWRTHLTCSLMPLGYIE